MDSTEQTRGRSEAVRPVVTEPRLGDIVLDTDVTIFTLTEYDFFKQRNPALISIVDILGLFAVAEALVLNERILSEHINDDRSLCETASVLLKSGILHPIAPVIEYRENRPDQFQKSAWRSLEPLATLVSGWPGADFTLSASIARARWCNQNDVDHLAWPVFGALPAAIVGRRYGILRHTYKHLSAITEARVAALRGVGSPIPMYIPPIPAVVLGRCGRKASRFLPEAVALRDEFARSRTKIIEHQRVVSACDRSLGELSQVYNDSVSDVVRELDRLKLKRTDSRLVLELWEAVGETKAGSGGLERDVQLGVNLGTLLSKGVKWLSSRRVRARARLLFDLHGKMLQIKNYGALINDVFGFDVSRAQELTVVENIGLTIDRLAAVDRKADWDRRTLSA